MAPKGELSDVTPVELAGAAMGKTRQHNGLNASEIAEILTAVGIQPTKRRKADQGLLIINFTEVR